VPDQAVRGEAARTEDRLVEIDWLGRAPWEGWNVPGGIHHDAYELPNGNILVLSAAPGSVEDALVEVDRDTGNVLHRWDLRTHWDPNRPRQPINLDDADWLHLNGLDYDAEDDAAILSGRDQSAVVKLDLETGKLAWILGNHRHWDDAFEELLLDPVGEPFAWPWGQHAPELHPEQDGRILIYDNGNHRSYEDPLPPSESYSRAVEYRIDEEAGTVRQIWQYGTERGSELYTPFIGDADYLENGNRLIVFGGVSRNLDGEPQALFDLERMEVNRMKISAHIVEVTAEQPARRVMELVFEDRDMSDYAGYRIYKAEKIQLYQ
jgi:arylsulfate sulfotransferase